MGKLLHPERLDGVAPRLSNVVHAAVETLPFDVMVVEGVRSRETCAIYYGKGRTAAQCSAKGVDAKYAQPKLAKVTWLNHPFESKHCKQIDGFGHAVDLLPAPYDWKDIKLFDQVAKAMHLAALKAGVPVRWGADWDRDGKPRERGETDSPHFEV